VRNFKHIYCKSVHHNTGEFQLTAYCKCRTHRCCIRSVNSCCLVEECLHQRPFDSDITTVCITAARKQQQLQPNVLTSGTALHCCL